MLIKKGSIGDFVKAWQTFLISQGLLEEGQDDGNFGPKTMASTMTFQKANDLTIDGIVGTGTISKASELGFDASTSLSTANGGIPDNGDENQEDDSTDLISMEQFSYIMKGAKRATLELHLQLVNACMTKYNINTPLRMQHFLSQCGHESCSLLYMHEIASGSEYEGRSDLGNTQPGDGRKFRGHGPIQLTGRLNHTSFFNYIGHPEYIDDPTILERDLGLAWEASGWYWSILRNINRAADKDDVILVTREVNGGLNGLDDRKQYLARAKEVIF